MIYSYLTESSNNFKQIPITKESIENIRNNINLYRISDLIITQMELSW